MRSAASSERSVFKEDKVRASTLQTAINLGKSNREMQYWKWRNVHMRDDNDGTIMMDDLVNRHGWLTRSNKKGGM